MNSCQKSLVYKVSIYDIWYTVVNIIVVLDQRLCPKE